MTKQVRCDCKSLQSDLGRLHALLNCWKVDLPRLTEECFQPCESCSRTTKHRNCQGGHLKIERSSPIRFPPNVQKFVVEIAAETSWEGPEPDDLSEHNIEIRIKRKDSLKTIHFSHIDLAGAGAVEPIHHLHFGGAGDTDDIFPRGVDSLRWPLPLYDVVLVCELVRYTFFSSTYRQDILDKSEAISLIRNSEKRFLKSMINRWNYYARNESSGPTFLAASCSSRRESK